MKRWEHQKDPRPGTWWCAFVDESVCGSIHLGMPDLFIPSRRTGGPMSWLQWTAGTALFHLSILASKRPHVISHQIKSTLNVTCKHGSSWVNITSNEIQFNFMACVTFSFCQDRGSSMDFSRSSILPFRSFEDRTPGRANCGKWVSGRLACWIACYISTRYSRRIYEGLNCIISLESMIR